MLKYFGSQHYSIRLAVLPAYMHTQGLKKYFKDEL